MPIPTIYGETDLKVFMERAIITLSDVLQWSIMDGDYDQAVTDTLLLYGVTDVADATDIGKLQAYARVAVLRNAEFAATGLVDQTVLGDSAKLSQIQDLIRAALAVAERQASSSYGLVTAATVVVTPVLYTDDPFTIQAEDVGL